MDARNWIDRGGGWTPARPVLITGAYGLLGGWLTHALVSLRVPVVVIRRDRTPLSVIELMGLVPEVTVVDGDITVDGLVQRVLTEYEIGSVFHLAAQTLVPSANRNPLSTFETNIRGTWLLLEACRVVKGIESVVVAASDKAYGVHSELPYRETHVLDPIYPYDVSKAAADMLARCYWHSYGLPVAVTRFSNIYGGGDFNASRLIPEAVGAVLADRAPVIRSDGSPERDFLYVQDAVEAYLKLAGGLVSEVAASARGEAREPTRQVAGEAFNAGGGIPHRVLDVVGRICDLAGTGIVPSIRGSGTPDAEIPRQWVDYAKIEERLGWSPRTPLDDGLEKTLNWYREFAESWWRPALREPDLR